MLSLVLQLVNLLPPELLQPLPGQARAAPTPKLGPGSQLRPWGRRLDLEGYPR